MLERQRVRLCETTAGVSLSTAQPHQHLCRSEKSQIFHSSHTFWQEQNEWVLHAAGERGAGAIWCMQSDFEICFTLSRAELLLKEVSSTLVSHFTNLSCSDENELVKNSELHKLSLINGLRSCQVAALLTDKLAGYHKR